mmetsp:Transcript_47463/g.112856  ORF Transcript_47463/g.112856 Transcript_47463/m.112856 type:complete len:289 (+) Transcript_47463:762-1628(+)
MLSSEDQRASGWQGHSALLCPQGQHVTAHGHGAKQVEGHPCQRRRPAGLSGRLGIWRLLALRQEAKDKKGGLAVCLTAKADESTISQRNILLLWNHRLVQEHGIGGEPLQDEPSAIEGHGEVVPGEAAAQCLVRNQLLKVICLMCSPDGQRPTLHGQVHMPLLWSQVPDLQAKGFDALQGDLHPCRSRGRLSKSLRACLRRWGCGGHHVRSDLLHGSAWHDLIHLLPRPVHHFHPASLAQHGAWQRLRLGPTVASVQVEEQRGHSQGGRFQQVRQLIIHQPAGANISG